MRRPLRFLAHKLELSDEQVTELATVLSALKTERAQAEVDQRRRTSALASAFEGSAFDAAKVDSAEEEQARSAERSHIQFCLGRQLPLLNFEAERAGGQLPLALSGEAGRGG